MQIDGNAWFMPSADYQTLSVRLPKEMHRQLRIVSYTMRRTMSKSLQSAVGHFLQTETRRLADELSSRVEALRNFAKDVEENGQEPLAVVAARERQHGQADPVEGQPTGPRSGSTRELPRRRAAPEVHRLIRGCSRDRHQQSSRYQSRTRGSGNPRVKGWLHWLGARSH